MSKRPDPPGGLVARGRGRRFWRAAWAALDERLVYDESECEVLTELCSVLDLIDGLEAQVRADGLTVKGSRGQPVPHPALAVLTAQRGLLAKLLAAVDFGGAQLVKSPTQARASKAARSRWDRPGARREA